MAFGKLFFGLWSIFLVAQFCADVGGQPSGTRDCSQAGESAPLIFTIGGSGRRGRLSDAELIDLSPDGKICAKPKDFPDEVEYATGVALDGLPRMCGGYNGGFTWTSSCYGYNATSSDWDTLTPLLEAKCHSASSLIKEGNGMTWIISGGYNGKDHLKTTEIRRSNGDNEFGPDLPQEMYIHCQVTVNDTHIFLLDHQNAYLMNPFDGSGLATPLPSPIHSYEFSTCGKITFPPENKLGIIVAGSWYTPHNQVEIFSLEDQTWQIGPDLPFGLSHSSGVEYQNSFYLVGGYNEDDNVYSDKIIKWDQNNGTWTVLDKTLKTARENHVAVLVDHDQIAC